MKKISALYCVRNEEDFIKKSIECVLPCVDEVIFVNNGSTDNTKGEVEKIWSDKIKMFDYPYNEPVDMGAVRTFSLEQATGDWIWQIDADEWYPPESCKAILEAVNNAQNEISFRVPYYNLAWRPGYIQKLEHYPDRLYRRDVIDKYEGVLPNDMTLVKKEHYQFRPFLEYDNANDKSFENPKQPIINAPFYHLARTRGYNYEFRKWFRYNFNLHPNKKREELERITKINQWVTGLYPMEKHPQTFAPCKNIKNPKVSVVIPNYNYGHFVGECIDSVLNQTYKPHEVIVVDDHSTDDSVRVISKKKVTLIERDHNGGVAAARNDGINRTTGDYFICIDADDKLAPTYIEETLAAIGENQICFTDLEFFGEQKGVNSYPDFSVEELKKAQIIPSTCALVDRRVFDASGGFDTSVIYEDWDWWLRLAEFKFTQVKKPLFLYRKHRVSRIDELDAKMVEGYRQLRERHAITRAVDHNRIKEANEKIK